MFRGSANFHIDAMQMDGLGSRTHLVEQGLLGPTISLAYDPEDKRLYWADETTGRIESVDLRGSCFEFASNLAQALRGEGEASRLSTSTTFNLQATAGRSSAPVSKFPSA